MNLQSKFAILGRATVVWLVALAALFFASPELAAAKPLFTLVTVDDQPPTLSYTGSGWAHSGTFTNAFWSTLSTSGVSGDTGNYSFTGSTITWFHSQAANRGTQDVYIDGSRVLTNASSYAPQTRRQIGTTFDVIAGSHTISIKPDGGGYTDIDAMAVDIASVGSGVYDDGDAQIRSIGTFNSASATGAYQGAVRSSNVAGNGFRFTFLGDNITYAYSKASNYGDALVTIDGAAPKPDISMYSSITQRQVMTVYNSLGPGVHILNVSVKGTGYVDADALVVAPVSRYMATTDHTTLYNEGCTQGKEGQTGVMILDFGSPDFMAGHYGAHIYAGGANFRTTDDIKNAAIAFMQGWYVCSPSTARLILSVGTQNNGFPTNGNGYAWASMIYSLTTWISNPPVDWSDKLMVRGGYDVEMQYLSASSSRAWTDGFASFTPGQLYYDFGNCQDCPSTTFPSDDPSLLYLWTLDDVWWVSWGAAPALPFPEIYNTAGVNASQWQKLSLYSYNHHPSKITIAGAMTQSQACLDKGSCSGIDNSPGAGWLSLYKELNSDPHTAQALGYISDITWKN